MTRSAAACCCLAIAAAGCLLAFWRWHDTTLSHGSLLVLSLALAVLQVLVLLRCAFISPLQRHLAAAAVVALCLVAPPIGLILGPLLALAASPPEISSFHDEALDLKLSSAPTSQAELLLARSREAQGDEIAPLIMEWASAVPLADCLHSPDRLRRQAAIAHIRHHPSPTGIAVLRRTLRESDRQSQAQAIATLKAIETKVLQNITDHRNACEKSPSVRTSLALVRTLHESAALGILDESTRHLYLQECLQLCSSDAARDPVLAALALARLGRRTEAAALLHGLPLPPSREAVQALWEAGLFSDARTLLLALPADELPPAWGLAASYLGRPA